MIVDKFKKSQSDVSYKHHKISIRESNIFVDDQLIAEDYESNLDPIVYAKSYVDSLLVLENSSIISDDYLVSLIYEHHSAKVTDTIVEAYKELILSEQFTLDLVVLDIKQSMSSISNKIEFVLEDNTRVAISESTKNKLLQLENVDKYKLVDYMKKSKENFYKVVEQVITNG